MFPFNSPSNRILLSISLSVGNLVHQESSDLLISLSLFPLFTDPYQSFLRLHVKMRSSLLISVAVFFSYSGFTNAQRRPEFLGIDSVIVSHAMENPPTFQRRSLTFELQESQAFPDLKASDLAIIENALPEVKPEVESDILEYAASIATQPEFLSAAAVLATAIPTSVQDQLANDPGKFLISLITATQPPPWATAIPTGIRNYLVSVGSHFASIANEDAEAEPPQPTTLRGSFVFPSDGFVIPTGVLPQGTAGFPKPTGTGVLPSGTGHALPSGTGRPPTGTGTGTGTGVLPVPTGGINGTTPTRGQASPISFAGSASLPLRRGGSVGAAAAFIGAACWLFA